MICPASLKQKIIYKDVILCIFCVSVSVIALVGVGGDGARAPARRLIKLLAPDYDSITF